MKRAELYVLNKTIALAVKNPLPNPLALRIKLWTNTQKLNQEILYEPQYGHIYMLAITNVGLKLLWNTIKFHSILRYNIKAAGGVIVKDRSLLKNASPSC